MWGILKSLGLLLVLSCFAHADIGLLLGESTGQGMSRWTSAGHSAVYLSRVCPDTPVHLRLCAPGEQGSVISNYVSFDEIEPYEWNIVPLSVFLYGVEDAKDRPLYASPQLRAILQENFRKEHLGDLCPEGSCTDPKAHWRDVIAANFVRDIYMFEVHTSLEQDMAFIDKFNALPNVDHYNGFSRNCADFARLVVNSYFPGAARPDHLNDFWMTSPKAISKSFTHYAVKHPELQFHVVRFTQIPGSYRRSSDARKGTEVAFTSKKWFFPMLLRSNELLMFTGSYMLTGRFNPELELRRRPTEEVTAQIIEAKQARATGDFAQSKELRVLANQQREAKFGSPEEWQAYSSALSEFHDQANERELFLNVRNAKDLANTFDEQGHVSIDDNGAIWLEYGQGAEARRLGVSASNVNSADSDGELAYTLLLARAGAELANSSKNREMLPEFQQNWDLLNEARRNLNWKIMARQLHLSTPSSQDSATDASQPAVPVGNALLP